MAYKWEINGSDIAYLSEPKPNLIQSFIEEWTILE